MTNTADRASRSDDGLIVPSHGNGLLKPFQKGVSPNPTGKSGLWAQVQSMCRVKSPEAVNKLVELMQCDDERVAMLAAQKVLEWAWGAPQPYKPGSDDGRMVLDLKSLSRAELTTLGNMVSRGAVRPAGADDGVVVNAVDETKPA
jgi:hypothetical protein